jgi:hypothetical protein
MPVQIIMQVPLQKTAFILTAEARDKLYGPILRQGISGSVFQIMDNDIFKNHFFNTARNRE